MKTEDERDEASQVEIKSCRQADNSKEQIPDANPSIDSRHKEHNGDSMGSGESLVPYDMIGAC